MAEDEKFSFYKQRKKGQANYCFLIADLHPATFLS
jgi:hypothetical protein